MSLPEYTVLGNCYVIDSDGGFSLKQNFQEVRMMPSNKLVPAYDLSNALQISLGVRILNDKIGITKDESNNVVLDAEFDASGIHLATDNLTISTTNLTECVGVDNIISMGRMSSLYSDFSDTVYKYFGLPHGFGNIFSHYQATNINGGTFDASSLIHVLNGNSFDVSGSFISDISGSATVSDLNNVLRFVIDNNIYNNRDPSDNIGLGHGFIGGDLIYVPDGITIGLTIDIESEPYAPITNIGPENLAKIDASINYIEPFSNVRKTTTYTVNNITQYYSVPLLFVLTNEDNFLFQDYGSRWIDVTTDKLAHQKWLAVSISTTGRYQVAIEELGDIYVSKNFGTTWTVKINIGEASSNSVSMSTSGQYQTASNGRNIYISNDHGETWNSVYNFGDTQVFVGVSLNGQYQNIISSGDSLYQSRDYGLTWVRFNDEYSELYNSIQMFPTCDVAMSYNGNYQTIVSENIYTSNDYGFTWNTVDLNPGVDSDWDDRNWISVAMSSEGKYQTALEDVGEIYVSDDFGTTWTKKNNQVIRDKQWRSVAMSANGRFQTALAKNGGVFVTIDHGDTWSLSVETTFGTRLWQGNSVSANAQYQTAVTYNGPIYVSQLI